MSDVEDYTPTPSMFREVYGTMCPEWCRAASLAEFDRMIAKVKADALSEAAEATRAESLGEPHAGASFIAHARWLDERADAIEGQP